MNKSFKMYKYFRKYCGLVLAAVGLKYNKHFCFYLQQSALNMSGIEFIQQVEHWVTPSPTPSGWCERSPVQGSHVYGMMLLLTGSVAGVGTVPGPHPV